MITLIIALVIILSTIGIGSLVIKVRTLPSENFDLNESDLVYVAMFFVIFLITPLLSMFVIAPLVQSSQEKEFAESERTAIYSLDTNAGVYGSFVFGTGHIETEMYYFYYTKGEYGYKIDKTKAKDIEIVERDDVEPIGYIVKYKEKFTHPNVWFSITGEVLFAKEKTVIYVPKNTVKITYNVSV
jgi:hypothetical protein